MKTIFEIIAKFVERIPAKIDIQKIQNGFLVNEIYCRNKAEVKVIILEELEKVLKYYKD